MPALPLLLLLTGCWPYIRGGYHPDSDTDVVEDTDTGDTGTDTGDTGTDTGDTGTDTGDTGTDTSDTGTPPPTVALRIQLTWTLAGDDLDLHLVRGSGATGTDQDCYYANCPGGLEWGTPGSANDPELVEDSIAGTGPEITVLPDPEPGMTYSVVVHDFPTSVPGDNQTTVEVYADEILIDSVSKTITTEDGYTSVLRVNAYGGITHL